MISLNYCLALLRTKFRIHNLFNSLFYFLFYLFSFCAWNIQLSKFPIYTQSTYSLRILFTRLFYHRFYFFFRPSYRSWWTRIHVSLKCLIICLFFIQLTLLIINFRNFQQTWCCYTWIFLALILFLYLMNSIKLWSNSISYLLALYNRI